MLKHQGDIPINPTPADETTYVVLKSSVPWSKFLGQKKCKAKMK